MEFKAEHTHPVPRFVSLGEPTNLVMGVGDVPLYLINQTLFPLGPGCRIHDSSRRSAKLTLGELRNNSFRTSVPLNPSSRIDRYVTVFPKPLWVFLASELLLPEDSKRQPPETPVHVMRSEPKFSRAKKQKETQLILLTGKKVVAENGDRPSQEEEKMLTERGYGRWRKEG
jgi:hypothetical protein